MQPGRVPGLILALAALAAGACAEPRVTSVPPAASTGQSAEGGAVSTSAVVAPVLSQTVSADAGVVSEADDRFLGLLRLERWAEAATAIDALPEARRSRPELRYARARVALATGDAARTLELLAGLETALPELAAEIERLRAEAQAVAGPYANAARYFARSKRAAELVRAAEAFERGGEGEPARKTIELAVVAAIRAKSTRDEGAARAVRARLGTSAGRRAQATTDLRWVALHVPASAGGRAALAALEHGGSPLGAKERLAIVDALLDAGSGAEALAIVDALAKRSDAPRADVLNARARALYAARDYPEAANAFQLAATSKTSRQAEQLFYAARSLARADRNDEALRGYQQLTARFKKSYWADRAAYLAARMHLTAGRWKEAASAYGRYLATSAKGDKRKDAEYERALALTSSGRAGAQAARAAFGKLAKRATPDEAARLHELEGVAALRAGDRDAAVRLWTDVAFALPLSWAALAARARLTAVSAALPPLLEPASPRPFTPIEVELPPAPARLSSIGLDGDAELWMVANESAVSSAYPGREQEALCSLYGKLAPAKRRYRIGLAAVTLPTLMRAPADADRWAWECVYPRPYAVEVASLEARHKLPTGLLHAIMRQESMFDPAITSSAAAVGLLQLLPTTATSIVAESGVAEDPMALTSPGTNLRLGAYYVAKLLQTFRGSRVLAAASYNAGPKAVSHWLEAAGDAEADLWVARIPYAETRKYVARVIGNHARYQWLAGGDGAVVPLSLELPVDARSEPGAY